MPTRCYIDAYSVGTPKWASWKKDWLKHHKTMVSPLLGCFFLVSKRTFYFFGRVLLRVLYIGRARHPGPGPRVFTPGELSFEFADIGGWLVILLWIPVLSSLL